MPPTPADVQPQPLHRKLLNFLGLRRSMAAMLAMVILVGMGENLAERFLPHLPGGAGRRGALGRLPERHG